MEKHRCKLCHRNFANGRALGGHMRSHMMNLYASSKAKQEFREEYDQVFMSEEIESVPSSSSSSSSDEEDGGEENGDKGLFSYGVSTNHHNLKMRGGGGGGGGMVDSDQFCFGGGEAAGSVVLQDRESETESSKNPIRRRSRRVRKSRTSDAIQFSDYSSIKELPQEKKPKSEKQGIIATEFVPSVEAEPVSSISDTTPEEDVAHCLMMLSKDKWLRRDIEEEQEEDFYTEEEEDGDEEEQEKETKKDAKKKKYYCHDFGVVKVTKSRSRGKYRCETCNKVFRSYQALGGHRASHKRIKAHNSNSAEEARGMMEQTENVATAAVAVSSVVEEKIHECPVCYRVFASGQALGGHKRSHVMGAAATNQHVSTNIPATKPFSRFGETFIDLNLPAPIDDDDISQIELSAVSDAEFVKPFKH